MFSREELYCPLQACRTALCRPAAEGCCSGCTRLKVLWLRLTTQTVKPGTCDTGGLRLPAAEGSRGGGVGAETGVRCSAGGADSLASSLGRTGGWELAEGGGEVVRVCGCDPA